MGFGIHMYSRPAGCQRLNEAKTSLIVNPNVLVNDASSGLSSFLPSGHAFSALDGFIRLLTRRRI